MFLANRAGRIYFSTAIFIFLGWATGVSASQKAQGSNEQSLMPLKELVKQALKSSPGVEIKLKEWEAARSKSKATWAKMHPSVDLEAIHGLKDKEPTEKQNAGESALSVNVNLNLYNNGQDRTNGQIAQWESEVANWELKKTRAFTSLEVSKEYFNQSKLALEVEIQKKKYEMLSEQFKNVETAYHAGAKPRNDYLRFRAQIQRADLDLLRVKSEQKKSVQVLSKLLGWESTQELPVRCQKVGVKTSTPSIPSEPQFEHHYDFQIESLKKKIQEARVSLSKRAYWPEGFVTTSLKQAHQGYLGNPHQGQDVAEWEALLKLKYNLWDGGERRKNLEMEKAKLGVNAALVRQARLQTRENVKKLGLDAHKLKRELSLTRSLLMMEQESFNVVEGEYQLGKASYLDFVTSVNDLLAARLSFQAAYFEYMKVLAEIHYNRGSIYEFLALQK